MAREKSGSIYKIGSPVTGHPSFHAEAKSLCGEHPFSE